MNLACISNLLLLLLGDPDPHKHTKSSAYTNTPKPSCLLADSLIVGASGLGSVLRQALGGNYTPGNYTALVSALSGEA